MIYKVIYIYIYIYRERERERERERDLYRFMWRLSEYNESAQCLK